MSSHALPTTRDAALHLFMALQAITDAGYTITGIDPERVLISQVVLSGSLSPASAASGSAPIAGPTTSLSSFTGDICSNCGSSEIQHTGTCGRCLNCGESTGCS